MKGCFFSPEFCRWRGWRGHSAEALLDFISLLAIMPMLLGVMGLVSALIWSLTKAGFPATFPTRVNLLHWEDITTYLPLVVNSGLLAASATVLSVTVVFLWLYNGQGLIRRSRLLKVAIYLPLLVPQISFYLVYKLGLAGLVLTAVGQR